MVNDDVFAVLAEPTRRRILECLRSSNLSVTELVGEVEASQPTVSKHLRVLRDAGLVSMRAQGQRRFYSLDREALLSVLPWFEDFMPEAVHKEALHSGSDGNRTASDLAAVAEIGPRGRKTSPRQVPNSLIEAEKSRQRGTSGQNGDEASQDSQDKQEKNDKNAAESVPQQIGRSVGRAATRAADLFANLPKFGRKKDSE